MPTDNAPIVPRPKHYERTTGAFWLSRNSRIVAGESPACRAPALRLQVLIAERTGLKLPLADGSPPAAITPVIRLRRTSSRFDRTTRAEGYRTTIRPDAVEIEAATREGFFHGIHSLAAMLERDGNLWRLAAGHLRDWPDFSWRGFLVDPARRFIRLERIRQYIEWMAWNKMNVLHVHFSDCEAFTIESKQFPALNEHVYHPMLFGSPRRPCTLAELTRVERDYAGCYPQAEIRRLVAYARDRGVMIVPELAMPSHATPLIRVFPELRCQTSGGASSDAVFCIGSERTYRVLAKMFDEIVPLFPSPVVHIGADEIDCRDVLYQGAPFFAQSWSTCTVCRARMKKEGLSNTYQLFYYFVRRVKRMLARYGKRMVMWNDYIDLAHPDSLPRDLLVHFWRIAMKQRGPSRACSFNKLLGRGFKVINSFYPDTYIDIGLNDQRLAGWNPARNPRSAPRLKARVVGAEMCAWADVEYYPRALPSAIPFFADRVWNKAPVRDLKHFAASLARQLFGPQASPELSRVFEYLGSIIPRPEKRGRFGEASAGTLEIAHGKTMADYQRFVRIVRRELRAGRCSNRPVLEEYLASLQGAPLAD